jgi:hypothetical protein
MRWVCHNCHGPEVPEELTIGSVMLANGSPGITCEVCLNKFYRKEIYALRDSRLSDNVVSRSFQKGKE